MGAALPQVGRMVDEHMPQGAPGSPLFWVGMEYRYMPPVAKLLEVVRAVARRPRVLVAP